MDEVTLRRMTVAEFFEWEPGDEERYELVEGVPVMMTGASARHDQIVLNILGQLWLQLRGSAHRAFTDDIAIMTPGGNVRRPDAGVNRGPLEPNATRANAVCAVVEVLSPSTRDFDMFVKLDEYKSIESMQHIIILDPDLPRALRWWRNEDQEWCHRAYEGLGAVIEITEPPLTLPLKDLYEGVTFTPPP
jgi:Uma2 family endonuclease